MKLVIVESPNKCETIRKYLGDGYNVVATKGHIRDLASSGKDGLGVDCDNNYKPTWIVTRNKRALVNDLRAQIKHADEVILATDPDREGEGISYSLISEFKLDPNTKRLEFHEITKDSINEAIKNPRTIDMDLVCSYVARRIIDRLVGYRLSDVLQTTSNLKSGGRVQSPTLKLIVDNERKIQAFVPEEYWNITAKFKIGNIDIEAPLYKYKGKEINKDNKLKNKAEADEVIASIGKELKILSVEKKEETINPKPPYTTAALQQDAISRFGFNSKKVSDLAQELYEGVSINGVKEGLITYIRTDSTYLSETYRSKAKDYISKMFGEEYVEERAQTAKKSANAQLAHEAIRPTSNHRTPAAVRNFLNYSQYRLYDLIYNRALAYMMKSKRIEITTVIIGNENVQFKITGNRTIYKGYEVLTGVVRNNNLPFTPIEGNAIEVIDTKGEQKFTNPPSRFTEARVVKEMEEKGIGRPSTYTSTINTLYKHEYIRRDKGAIIPTPKGIEAIEYLEKSFPDTTSSEFTAELEKDLDDIRETDDSLKSTIDKFYLPFMKIWDVEMKKVLGKCPKCGADLVRIKGRYGSFIGCSRYPGCDYKVKQDKSEKELLDRNCPQCGAPLIKRTNKKGKSFIGCSNFPKCRFIEGKEEVKKLEIIRKCPDCKDGNLVIRRAWNPKKKRMGEFLGCTNYPKCKHFVEYNPEDNNDQ